MPFANGHACLIDDSLEVVGSQRRNHEGKEYIVRIGKKAGAKGSAERSYFYPKDVWSEESARAHCKKHGGSFEPAKGGAEHFKEEKNPFIPRQEEK